MRAPRRPPRTLAGDVTRRLLTLAVGAAVGSASALLVARWLDRPAAIGLSVLSAVILVAALVGACTSRQRMTYEYDSAEMPLRPRPGFTFAAIGAVLILLGVLVETV